MSLVDEAPRPQVVEFHGFYTVSREVAYAAPRMLRERVAYQVWACGHDCDESAVKVQLSAWHILRDRPQLEWAVRSVGKGSLPAWVHVTVPRIPRHYPACGDWACDDECDWQAADPLDEPAVFAGAAAERRMLDRFPDSDFRLALEALQGRRNVQAKGEPLWTIDLRPPAFQGR